MVVLVLSSDLEQEAAVIRAKPKRPLNSNCCNFMGLLNGEISKGYWFLKYYKIWAKSTLKQFVAVLTHKAGSKVQKINASPIFGKHFLGFNPL